MRASQVRRERDGGTLLEFLIVIACIALLIGLLLAGVQKVRHRAAGVQCANNMRQLGLAAHAHHDARRALPAGISYLDGRSPTPHLGWPGQLLPYFEQSALAERVASAYAIDKFFLTPAHALPRETVLTALLCPLDSRLSQPKDYGTFRVAFTSYLGLEGIDQWTRDGLLYLDSAVPFSDVRDGLGNTLLIGERPPSADLKFGWWYAGWGQEKDGSAEMILGAREVAVDVYFRRACPDAPITFRAGSLGNQCDALHFWSLHTGGAYYVFADGSVRFLRYGAAPLLPQLATRSGGETVDLPE